MQNLKTNRLQKKDHLVVQIVPSMTSNRIIIA